MAFRQKAKAKRLELLKSVLRLRPRLLAEAGSSGPVIMPVFKIGLSVA
jgi:hypothetical protein